MVENPKQWLLVDQITKTNPNIDEEYVGELVLDLVTNRVRLEQLKPIFVRYEKGYGYFAVDGSHHLEALQRAGERLALAEIFSLGQPITAEDLQF